MRTAAVFTMMQVNKHITQLKQQNPRPGIEILKHILS